MLDFPKYDDKSDPLTFINRCESYFHQQRIAVEEQVWMASYNLEAGAQMWFIQVQQDEGTPSCRRFTKLLNLCFGPPICSNPLGELMACKRTGSVTEYQDRFEALLPCVGMLTEAQRVQAFMARLQPPLSLDVEIHNPQSHCRHEPRPQARATRAVCCSGCTSACATKSADVRPPSRAASSIGASDSPSQGWTIHGLRRGATGKTSFAD